MHRHLLRAAFLCLPLILIAGSARASELEQHLREQYLGKTFALRHFYSSDRLRYESSGEARNAAAGDWTEDGFVVVNKVHISGGRVTIEAKRLLVISMGKQLQIRAAEYTQPGKKERKPVLNEIEADLGTDNPPADQTDAAMSRIFLTSADDFANQVPDYWKPCVPAGLNGNDANCHFSAEILAVPGVRTTEEVSSPATANAKTGTGAEIKLYHVGRDISPPKLTYNRDPEFSESARQLKYEGTAVLKLVVNEEGLPTNIHIVNPLGCGLDAKAVEAVQQWRFKPAEKDGLPVPVEIAVEVSFHLY